jgi:glycosyltransferase involved in cell wall biosynthesis
MECIVVDGMSTDGTRELAEAAATLGPRLGFPIRALDNPRGILAAGWNLGIGNAKGEIICRIDAHAEICPDYLLVGAHELLRRQGRRCACVGGVIGENVGEGLVGKIAADLFSSKFGVGNSPFRVPGGEIQETDTAVFALYWKDVFLREGRFNETLDRNQDIEFHRRIRRNGWRLVSHPAMRVRYHVRQTLPSLLKKAASDGYWVIFSGGSVRHKVPLLFVIYLIVAIFGSLLWSPAILTPLAVYAVCSLVFACKDGRSVGSKALLPFFFLLFHCAYGLGSLRGAFDYLTKRRMALNQGKGALDYGRSSTIRG